MRAFSRLFVAGNQAKEDGAAEATISSPLPRASTQAPAEDLPEIICEEETAYGRRDSDPLSEFGIPICDFYLDGFITSYMPAGHPLNPIYRDLLGTLVPDRHRVLESLEEWLDALADAAAGRRIAACFGASHTCMIPNWPYPMARRLDSATPGQWVVVNAGVSGWTVFRIADFLPILQGALGTRGLRIDRALSLDGANDILYRLRQSYKHFIEPGAGTPSILLDYEEAFLCRHGRPPAALPVPGHLDSLLPRLEAGGDYGGDPPVLFRPLPEWTTDMVDRFLFSAEVLHRIADGCGIPFVSMLQPMTYCPVRSPQAQQVRRDFRARFPDGGPDFFRWRRENRTLLHGGEYWIVIPPKETRIDAVVDFTAPMAAVTANWKRMADDRPDRFVDLNDLYHRTEAAGIEGFFQPDCYHYSQAGSLWIGEQAAGLLLSRQ
jgi:hypothetical protein